MLHLLPQYQKRKVIKEYRLRLGLVIISTFFFAVIMFAVFTLPSFILLRSEKISLELKKTTLQSTINMSDGGNGEIAADIAKSIVALKPFEKTISPNLFIDALAPETNGIAVSGYAFSQANPTDPISVVLSGTAKTREDLTAYADILNSRFGGVKLPLSSLANSSNISFDFRFTMTYDKAKAVQDSQGRESANSGAASTVTPAPTQ